MTDEQQAAAEEPKTEATTEVADSGAQDDLESLLAEFDTAEAKPESTADDDLKVKVQRLEEQVTASQNQAALQKVIQNVKGDLDVDDDFVEAWLRTKAIRDPRYDQAYANRDKNPAAWAKIEKGFAKELGQRFPKVDADVTQDVEAVASAVRGASTKAPADDDIPADIGSMSDTQFEQWAATQKA